MSMQGHLAELTRKHEALEREIQGATTRPSEDELRLAELKRRKLALKDEMERARRALDESAPRLH